MTNEVPAMVREFIKTFEPTPGIYSKLVLEEAAEVQEALANLLKELCDLVYVLEGLNQTTKDPQVSPELQMFIIAAMTFFDGFEACFGEGISGEAFTRVHRSNMSKCGPDGKPVRREDGKVLKGPFYKPADMLSLIKAK